MSEKIVSLGEVLVEVMRPERGLPLNRPGTFRGPFASGAPLIFAAATGRLGAATQFAGVRGDDAFGDLCEQHLTVCGVTPYLRTSATHATGVAFVAYRTDGDRDFLFHLHHSAAALLEPADITDELFAAVAWLHITGSTLAASASARSACEKAVRAAKARGATVSFDPNLRLELMSAAEVRQLCGPVLDAADIVLPSGTEAALLLGIDDVAAACRTLADMGKIVLLKNGEHGCKLLEGDHETRVASISVTETDPTGAGDAFAAGLAVARLQGRDWVDAARFANVVGALSTQTFGPAEGLPTLQEVEARL
ncbi:sugar kinase [soil metagenome]